TTRFNLSTAPIHGAPLSCLLAIADMAEISAVLDRRFVLELGGLQLMFDIPMSHSVTGRVEERALERRPRAIDGTLPPTRNPREGVLGGSAKSGTGAR